MRSFLLASNLLVVLASAAILGATFFARDLIERSARAALLSQSQGVVTPWVDKTEAAVRSPLVSRLLTADQRALIEKEIAEYRAEPK
ncbi:MAG TPA: hypothetical protein VD994_16245, partial [Prosthecobacter sp.]|nr:hypothetical protein [Prosthecobacter sp.]